MIVTCPQCSKRYMLDDELLPKEGRQVRCISCEHVWCQVPNKSPSVKPLFLNDKEPPHPLPKKRFAWIKWSACLLVILFVPSLLVFWRDDVIEHFPQLRRVYKHAGLLLNSQRVGLDVENVKILVSQGDREEMFAVSGDIKNSSRQVKSIPPLKLKLVGEVSHPKCLQNTSKNACILEKWNHRLSESFLLPGEIIHFETSPRPKAKGAHHILVEF